MFLAIMLLIAHGHVTNTQVLGATPTRAECETGIARVLAASPDVTQGYQDAGFTVKSICVDVSAAHTVPAPGNADLQGAEPKTRI